MSESNGFVDRKLGEDRIGAGSQDVAGSGNRDESVGESGIRQVSQTVRECVGEETRALGNPEAEGKHETESRKRDS